MNRGSILGIAILVSWLLGPFWIAGTLKDKDIIRKLKHGFPERISAKGIYKDLVANGVEATGACLDAQGTE